MITYAADFESYYDDECSIKVLGNRGYYSHENFEAYMISVVGDNGYRWCGHPKDFDWSLFAGNKVISHNAAFDEGLYLFGVEKGWYPKVEFAEWLCSADLCAYFGIPRSLKGACKWLFGMEMSKTTRDNMKGKRWELMSEDFKKEVTEYALLDGDLCLRVWQELEAKWPEWERAVSLQHREMMRRGIPMDVEAVDAGIVKLKQAIFDAESLIPWAGEKKLLSPIAFAEECRKFGIEPPSSMAITSEECDDWMERFGETLPFAAAVRNWRRINSLLKKLEAFSRSIENGLYYGGIMYCGAHTRRASGSGGNLNLQNLPKGEMFGIKVRNFIKAREGKKLVVVDLSQIEVRVVHWLAGDEKTMQLMREVPDIYTVFAIMFKRWTKEDGDLKKLNPELRQNMKTVGLGVQFGAGAGKVAVVSGMSERESASFISAYIKSMPLVPKLWKSLKQMLAAARRDGTLVLEFPSGNSLVYRDVKALGRNTTATLVKNGQPVTVRLWHGSLIENCAQSLARDIFMDRVLAMEDAGYKCILHIHDEVVLEVDEADAQKCLDEVTAILSTPPDWIPNIPLAADGSIMDLYDK